MTYRKMTSVYYCASNSRGMDSSFTVYITGVTCVVCTVRGEVLLHDVRNTFVFARSFKVGLDGILIHSVPPPVYG